MNFTKLDEKKIREIRKLAAGSSLTWGEISNRVGVSPPTCTKYGAPVRQGAAQSTPQEKSDHWDEVENCPEVVEARKRLILAKLEHQIREVDEEHSLEDRVSNLEDALADHLEDLI